MAASPTFGSLKIQLCFVRIKFYRNHKFISSFRMKLTPQLLLSAYSQGIFPMGHDDGYQLTGMTLTRAVFCPSTHFMCRPRWRNASGAVALTCASIRLFDKSCWPVQHLPLAASRPGLHPKFWPRIPDLHEGGFAHSVETWLNGQLVGGLYGVALGGLFAGEEMSADVTDASKIALVHLIEKLRANGFVLHDTQFMTEHLRRFGAVEIPRAEYQRRLQQALKVPLAGL